ncbi:unnamed protein product [Dicrocoelium dendriticum]|nr:unnamed protein product [Dicrocoelium dendriticum]
MRVGRSERQMFYVIPLLALLLLNGNEAWRLENQTFSALSNELVRYINSLPHITWKAEKSKRFRTLDDLRRQLGARFEHPAQRNSWRPTVTHEDVVLALPKAFNSIEQWPQCETIAEIRDQSSCGSCWAFGAVSAMSDRMCIHTKGEVKNLRLSARDLLSCCTKCGAGCLGGWPGAAWDHWRDVGIVDGGAYNDTNTCLPYPFPPCGHHHSTSSRYPPCPEELYSTPECVNTCVPNTHKDFNRYYSVNSYNIIKSASAIMKEIWLHGPVEASFNVYEDFTVYKSGIYEHVAGDIIGGHAVRIIGWGEENGIPYWLIANSWNTDWGENGFFRMLRGKDHCGIEHEVVAGMYVLPS